MELLIDNRTDVEIEDDLIEKLNLCVEECIRVEKFPKNVEISLSLVDRDEIKKLNSAYRDKDSVTDVLSFPMVETGEDLDESTILLGDIVICVSKAREQANEYGHSFEREMCYLTIHSMFHLFGYDHMSSEDKLVMRSREKEVLSNIKL